MQRLWEYQFLFIVKVELISKTKVFHTHTHFIKETLGNLEMVHSDVSFPLKPNIGISSSN